MDRKKQIAALTDDEGERLLLAQACERLTRAAVSYTHLTLATTCDV